MRKTQLVHVLVGLYALLATGLAAQTRYTYTTLDVPPPLGSSNWVVEETYAQGISGTNVVGYYTRGDVAGPPGPPTYGFLYNGSSYTTFSLAFITAVEGISGTNIVGYDGNDPQPLGGERLFSRVGFVFNGNGFSSLVFPPSQFTYAQGISATNIVGFYADTNLCYHGFLYNGITWSTFDAPLGVGSTKAYGISVNNIVGNYEDTDFFVHGFLYNGSTWTTLDHPLAGNQGSYAVGISSTNIVGYYYDSSDHAHGFLYNGSTWSTLDAPLGVGCTYACGISDNNIVGYYTDTNSVTHGFIATPTPQLTIRQSGNLQKISWPSNPLMNWTLQQSSDLTTTNWIASGGSFSNDGTNNSATFTAKPGGVFFRLLKQ